MISTGILFALMTALAWGTADIFAKKAIQKTGEFRALFFNQLLGTIPVVLYAYLFYGIPLLSLEMFALALVTGFLVTVFWFVFYIAMRKGNLSLVNPISGSYLMITTVAGAYIFNETLKLHQLIAIIVIFAGIFLVSTDLKKIRLSFSGGVKEAIVAMFGWGVAFLLVKIVSLSIGAIASFIYIRLAGLFLMFCYSQVKKTNFVLSGKNAWCYVAAAGILDAIGQLGYNAAVIREQISVAAPIVATFPAVTVVLALVFLKEKLVLNQKFGVASILTGLVLISAA